MSYPLGQRDKHYTYEDYMQLPQDTRCEVIEGILYMTPSPSIQHQRTAGKLYNLIANYIKATNNTCEVFISPLDVLLPENNQDVNHANTIVQPDIFVVCDSSIITEKFCTGSPDLIIEIVSPSSPSRDYVKKLHLYEKHMVKEYWIVNYIRKEILVYRLMENDEYGEAIVFKDNEQAKVETLGELYISLNSIFD
ncbi:protein of unknown function DUF820 [Desulfofarcimen acetoxidans DSM 771]|jgi:Uma2 family endonuclease|uniref:Putative restriction endonuclease domain-containing protein n=1 Tax=Desulfofarcimen acetoxidans (strain ATCC 49208 / DSM 771 / KCTC 5769 / VKM B-1644 / 5575) TaxID=485916 RepID=C8W1C1_DESAS|nr:Uma2 family endonuclease [Desulfofarcimen acetoxidans]ACV61566.1 protein of unknown function DUF820 [Desulfofarcimen acetoxidans DSM 771]